MTTPCFQNVWFATTWVCANYSTEGIVPFSEKPKLNSRNLSQPFYVFSFDTDSEIQLFCGFLWNVLEITKEGDGDYTNWAFLHLYCDPSVAVVPNRRVKRGNITPPTLEIRFRTSPRLSSTSSTSLQNISNIIIIFLKVGFFMCWILSTYSPSGENANTNIALIQQLTSQKRQYNPTVSARTKQPAQYGRRLNWQYDISMICRSFETLWLSFVTFWCPVVIINCANAQPPLCALITDFKDDAFMNLWNSTCCKLNCFAQAKITWREGRSKVGTLPSALLKVIFDMHLHIIYSCQTIVLGSLGL